MTISVKIERGKGEKKVKVYRENFIDGKWIRLPEPYDITLTEETPSNDTHIWIERRLIVEEVRD